MAVKKRLLPIPVSRALNRAGLTKTPARKDTRTPERKAEDAAWDAYFIPGTDTMRNNLGGMLRPAGIRDEDKLRKLEEQLSMAQMIELHDDPIPGQFDYAHMKKIHAQLFHEVYPWAGQQRTVDLVKENFSYAPLADVESLWETQHEFLMEDAMLRGITDKDAFTDKLAFHWGMANYAHGFREGNTRSQTMFFHQLADEAGWDLDISMLDPKHPESIRDEFIAARFHHQSSGFDHAPLAEALSKAVTRRDPELQRELYPGKDRGSVPHRPGRAAPVSDMAENNTPTTADAVLANRYRRFPELAPDNDPKSGSDINPVRLSADCQSMMPEL